MKKLLLIALIGITTPSIFSMPAGSGKKEFEEFKNLYQQQNTSVKKQLVDAVYSLYFQMLMMAFGDATRDYKDMLNKTLPAKEHKAIADLQSFTINNHRQLAPTEKSAAELYKKIVDVVDQLNESSDSFAPGILFLNQIMSYMKEDNAKIVASTTIPAGGATFESAAAPAK